VQQDLDKRVPKEDWLGTVAPKHRAAFVLWDAERCVAELQLLTSLREQQRPRDCSDPEGLADPRQTLLNYWARLCCATCADKQIDSGEGGVIRHPYAGYSLPPTFRFIQEVPPDGSLHVSR
jgi:hypothetical protein